MEARKNRAYAGSRPSLRLLLLSGPGSCLLGHEPALFLCGAGEGQEPSEQD